MSEPYRVLVIEDDLDVAVYTKTVLEKRIGCIVVTISDPSLVSAAVIDLEPDVVITDIEMPGASGLDLIGRIRELRPGTPVIVMTAHVSVDYAVTALRNHADEFLTKPVSSADLVTIVTRLAEESRVAAASAPDREVVLAIGAHPDDVEVGVGGILAAHSARGDAVTILTLSRGWRDGGIRQAWDEGSAAAGVIGAQLLLEDHPEPQIDSAEPTVSIIRKVVSELKPTIVYMHTKNERHLDHRAVYEAAMVATAHVRTVACYQGSTATVDFRPTRFISIDGFTDAKLSMLSNYATDGERPDYLDPDFVLATARYWARFGHGQNCEPLEIIRESVDVA